MALKTLFDTMKRDGYIIKKLDQYLYSLNDENGENRAIDVNAPSSAGGCKRAHYYRRLQFPQDSGAIEPRLRRIFDNGTKTHERLQEYLRAEGMLLMAELPVRNDEYNIQGHTDGLLQLTPSERGILEIKSINSHGFSNLREAREDHKQQALVYIYCVEERRKHLHETYSNRVAFDKSLFQRRMNYLTYYSHLKDGSQYTKSEKLAFQCSLHEEMDSLLFDTETPITKVVFLYENKDTQDLKEFTVSMGESISQELIKGVLSEYRILNEHIERRILPEREGKNKSDTICRWCNYKSICWEK